MALDNATFETLIDTLRRFVREKLVPAEDEVERTNDIPHSLVDEIREMGLFGLSIPEEYGGLGLGLSQEVAAVAELTWASIAFRSLVGTNNGIGSQGIIIDGTEEQKSFWLPKLASGKVIASFCLTEPDAGSDAGSLRTTALLDGDHYLITGTKRYATNAPRAGLFTVMARTNPAESGSRGISAFLIPAGLDGISLGKPDRKMGQRGTRTCDVIFDEVRVPASHIIGGVPDRGFKTAMKVLDRGRIHIAAAACGMAERLIAESLRFAREREQFGQPIANFQLVKAMLADSRAEASAAFALVQATARRYDTGERVTRDAASCKYFASEMVGRVADRAVQVHGGAGYMNEYPVERFYRDARLLRIYEGTSQIQQLIIAREMLKG